MVEIGQDQRLLERVHARLDEIGVGSFRASILNAFPGDIEEDRYAFINTQIERCRRLGIGLIRVNDSVGTLLPHTTAVLAANLVRDNPDTTFYLHGHDDRGMGTANSLVSVMHGFQMVEGGVGGFGNRAGLPVLEALATVFAGRGITVATGPLDVALLSRAAAVAEDVFMVLPDVYRAVSGMLVRNENAGIVNVPDYLGVDREVDYFLNPIGLFPRTVAQVLAEAGMPARWVRDEAFVGAVCARLLRHMEQDLYPRKRAGFDALIEHVRSFYTGIVRLEDVEQAALEELQAADRSGPARALTDAAAGS
jgi:2-isopropylmalate synthase